MSLQPHFVHFITVGLSCSLWKSQPTSCRSRWGRWGLVAHTSLPWIQAECSLQTICMKICLLLKTKNPKHSNNTSLIYELLSFIVEWENMRSRWGPVASEGQCWATIESVSPCVQTSDSGAKLSTDGGLSLWCSFFFFFDLRGYSCALHK